ncbi:ribonuclease Z [Staphylococcus sp. 11261D007BR]
MEVTFFGTSAGLPTKERHTQSVALKLEPYSKDFWLFDVGEGTQHQILHHSIKLGKVSHIFITHMHGDHLYGLPGVLTSRSFQGGADKPLTIIGPKGIKAFIEHTMSLSYAHLSYPIKIIEIEDEVQFSIDEFKVKVLPLNHGVPSYGFRIEAPYTPGKLDVNKLKEIGIPPGPKYQEIKVNDTFEYNGKVYDANAFKGPEQKGPVVTVFGDTKPCDNELILAQAADVIIHEATFLEGDHTLANEYFHSHINDVLQLIESAQVKHALLTHISNRYTKEEVEAISTQLRQHHDISFELVNDFDSYQF